MINKKIPKKEKKCMKNQRHSNTYLTHAKKIYKEICPMIGINPKIHNPFKLRYTNCKPDKRTILYYEKINEIMKKTNYWIYHKMRSREFNRFLNEAMKPIPYNDENLKIDPSKVSETEPETKPKQKFIKSAKPENFPQLLSTQDSYFLLLIYH